MDAFLPSEIGRLIYGYLFQQCGEGLADEFLNSCDSMRECCLLKQKYAKNFHHKVQDLSLEDILNQYSVLCSLIFKQATGEEPVHRNVLGLLKKVLGSRLLGLAGSSADCSRVAKPAGDKVDNSVSDKTEASKTAIGQSKRSTNVADKAEDSVGDKTGAVETVVSVAQSQPANPIDEDIVAVSSDVSDAGDNSHMDVDDDFSSGDALAKEAPLDVAKESAPTVASAECQHKIVSPSAESRICAVLSNSASMEERARQFAGMSNLPLLAEHCTPRKQQKSISVPSLSCSTNLTKTTISVAATVTNTTNVMKSIENVSKNLSSAAESGLGVPKSGEHSSGKLADKVTKKEKALQRDTSRTSSETTTTTSTGESTSSATIFPATKVDDQFVVTTHSTSAVEVSPTTVLLNLPRVSTPTISFVYQEPRVSTVPSPVTSVQRAPAPTSAGAIIPEESTESVFGELSFDSECSLPGRLDRSNSSVKSDSEAVNKLSQSPAKCSAPKVDASSVDSLLSTRPEVTVTPIQNSATRKSETTLETPTISASDAVVLPDSDETASAGSRKKDTPWDLNLRSFFDEASLMDAHITKRKPKDLRNRKLKEVSKKRKHNDDISDPLSTAKRFKSETVAAVPVSVATPRQSPLVSKSVDTDRTVGGIPSPLRRRRATKDGLESTVGLEKKSAGNSRSKGGRESKMTLETANLVGAGEERARTPEAASSARSSTPANDILDWGHPVAEKKKSERLEKAATAERKQQTANVKKANREEFREAAKTRSRAKSVALGDQKAGNSTGTAKGGKKSERIEDRVAAKKKSKDVVDPKMAPLKSSLPQVKEKPVSSPRKTNGNRKDAQSKVTDDVTKDTVEIPEDHNRSSSVAIVETTFHDPMHSDEELYMVLEITPEFELYCRSPKYEDS